MIPCVACRMQDDDGGANQQRSTATVQSRTGSMVLHATTNNDDITKKIAIKLE